MIGQTLGKYHILRKLGEGGMGTVYLAQDEFLKREVALKIITSELSRKPSLMARFKVEAIAQARLNHSNIVTIYSFEQQDDMCYIVMEYVPGKTVKDIISETGPIPFKQALMISTQIAAGLAYAHSKGVLHRDIKPANILLSPDGCAKIGDFGIAKVSDIDGLTMAGAVIGTPLYSSPEQIRCEKTGPATDIYSLGLTLYEMLTGTQPFQATGSGSYFKIQKAHLEITPQAPSTYNPSVPKVLDAIILKCLAKTPAERYADANSFATAIYPFWESQPIPSAGKSKKARVSSFDLSSFRNLRLPSINLKRLKRIKDISFFKGLTGKGFSNPSRKISAFMSRLTSTGNNKNKTPLTQSQKRRLLVIILVPLIILLLIAVAYSEPLYYPQVNGNPPALKKYAPHAAPENINLMNHFRRKICD